MASKQLAKRTYADFSKTIGSGQVGNFYIFHGEEKFLLERSLADIRDKLCPDGPGGFNYRRYEGSAVTIDELDIAVNTLPGFAERALVEVFDYDIFPRVKRKQDNSDEELEDADEGGNNGDTAHADADRERLLALLSDLPDYVCLIFIYDTLLYKPDKRRKFDAGILACADVMEFEVQEKKLLVSWITRHFKDAGKSISPADAEYLAFITGGYMSSLLGEIGKVSVYSTGERVTRGDIDTVVTPILDTVIYKLTDALVSGNNAAALRILDELLRMREAPHRILFNISVKMRQLLAARVWVEHGLDRASLMEVCGIRYDFQATPLMNTARKTSLPQCRSAVLACSDSALLMNSSAAPEACLIELVAKLGYVN